MKFLKSKILLTLALFLSTAAFAVTAETVFTVSGSEIKIAIENDPEFGSSEKIDDNTYRFHTPSGYEMLISFFDMKYLDSDVASIKQGLRQKTDMGKVYENEHYLYLYYTLKREVNDKPAVGYFVRGLIENIMFGFEIKVPEEKANDEAKQRIDLLYQKVAGKMRIVPNSNRSTGTTEEKSR